MEKTIEFLIEAAEASNDIEKTNTELKRKYLIRHVMIYNYIVRMINGNRGSFGTGYPFYALGENLTGNLPIIDEQLRYNNELINAVEQSEYSTWNCAECLAQNSESMPDLKQICKPCPNMDDALKPRKIINRLLDIDMWMVCNKKDIESAKEQLIMLFDAYNLQTSDNDPVQTIINVTRISKLLKEGISPDILLPLDAHIIDYETLYSLIEKVPEIIYNAHTTGKVPYLPIHPLSYRKTWQYDDTAYNFVHDYLSSFTPYNFDEELRMLLEQTRNEIANDYSFEELYECLLRTGPESVLRRHRTLELKNRFKERVNSWKK